MKREAVRVLIAVLAGCACASIVRAQGVEPLSIRIANEQAPPGGVIQVKLEVTEPKPISTGGGHLFFGELDDLIGVAVHSLNGDAAAVVVKRQDGMTVRLASPSGTLGLQPDYPLLTMALRVPANATLGIRQPLTLEGAAEFLDPSGLPYPYEFRAGEALIAPVPSIANVSPGSADLPAGSIVMIEGVGFKPGVRVRFKETALASVEVLSPSVIRVVLAQPAVMHGMEIQIRGDSSDARSTYFSYQRTTRLPPSTHSLFAAIEPAFPAIQWTNASLRFQPAALNIVPGLALQNLSAAPALPSLELINASGVVAGQTTLALPPNTRAVRTLVDLFGTTCGGEACTIRVRTGVPLQVLGILGDTAQQSAAPLLPSGGSLSLVTTTNAASYRAGDLLAVQAIYTPGDTPIVADTYIVLELPSGAMMSLTPEGLVSGITPFASNVTVTAMSQEVLRVFVPPGTPFGTYRWLSALTVPGTLSLLTAVASTSITVVP